MKEVKVIKSLVDLPELPTDGSVDIPRQDMDLRIPIKAISASESNEIMKKNRAPAPPKKMGRDENNKPTGVYYLDENDPLYLELLQDSQMDSIKDMALAGIDLPFSLGSTAKLGALGSMF